MQLSDKIRIIRKARGLSQEGLGFSLSRVSENGVSRQAVSDWENGKSEPKLENIRDLAKVLGVSFDALLDESIDLDDPQVLDSVLRGGNAVASISHTSDVEASIHYSIYHYDVCPKKFKVTIWSGVIALLTIFTGLLGLVSLVFLYVCAVLGCMSFTLFFIALPNEILRAAKGRMAILAGSIGYESLSISDQFVQIDGYNKIGNNLYVPMDLIADMALCGEQHRIHGDVIVKVDGKEHPMILVDVVNPQKLVDTFNKIKESLKGGE